jgi:sterol desaturase/sphingolipid hydroxylase (fatty acid hydroxylase superfamily)
MMYLNLFKRGGSMPIVIAYAVYLLLSVAVTIWVARTLHRSGRVLLVQAFPGNSELADSINRLLVVGFYLLNLGYVALALATTGSPADARQAIELVSGKLGVVLLVLGGLHFFNLYVIHRLRHRAAHPTKRYVDHILD